MRIDSTHLFRLPVVTEDKQHVGHVVGVIVDINFHSIFQYRVCPNRCLDNWFHQRQRHELLVAPSQVVSISSTQMVIRSGITRDAAPSSTRTAHAIASAPAPLTAATSTLSSAS